MAYDKQTWTNGDIITADKLNYIESGIENISSDNVLWVTASVNGGSYSLNKTYNEILDAYNNEVPIFIKRIEGNSIIICNLISIPTNGLFLFNNINMEEDEGDITTTCYKIYVTSSQIWGEVIIKYN